MDPDHETNFPEEVQAQRTIEHAIRCSEKESSIMIIPTWKQ